MRTTPFQNCTTKYHCSTLLLSDYLNYESTGHQFQVITMWDGMGWDGRATPLPTTSTKGGWVLSLSLSLLISTTHLHLNTCFIVPFAATTLVHYYSLITRLCL